MYDWEVTVAGAGRIARIPQVQIQAIEGDVADIDSDCLILKYAQKTYGVDRYILSLLESDKAIGRPRLPSPGKVELVTKISSHPFRSILFIGLSNLAWLDYDDVRDFGFEAISQLRELDLDPQTITLTLHGPGFGLDERVAFEYELSGLIAAISSGRSPDSLSKIVVVDSNPYRVEIMKESLSVRVPSGFIDRQPSPHMIEETSHLTEYTKDQQSVFVAMPFGNDFDDVYYYGIRDPIQANSMLCIRADESILVGDINAWIRKYIENSTLVVAELSGANPNVYLEVGYAWALRIPCLLLAKKGEALKFDVRGHRCIFYESIRDLDKQLDAFLKQFRLSNHQQT